MNISHWTIVISWLAFLLYWGISAIGVKKDIAGKLWWSGRSYLVRLIIAITIVLIVIFEFPDAKFGHVFGGAIITGNGATGLVAGLGAIFCALGISLAIWARFHLGRNWSSHPALKEDHELVTSGPYRFIRHPIYTGILLAELGTGLAVGYVWLIPLLLGAIIFIRRVSIEEEIMMKNFPDKYPDYKKRTKALIPFIW